MKLCLGTAQLGLHYGINNKEGMLSEEQAFGVLDAAYEAGFRAVDTAAQYGKSEERIGKWLRKTGADVEVITKEYPDANTRAHSMEMLGRIDTLLYHCLDCDISCLSPIMADGISVYTHDEVMAGIGFGQFQVPASIVDGRNDETIAMLKRRGKRVMIRSVLLQGRLAEYTSARELAIRWIYELAPDVAIIGAETPGQIREVAEFYKHGPLPRDVVQNNKIAREDIPEEWISPRTWGQHFDFAR